ncbi:50S ribosomal protein L1 [Babesia caballi]|uniref:50S ribosomal protein L1 n=1 Tax=Babesia caballi TaxID=5871 RepID=A0AAV4LRK5_BABCB|nr:50S ribosomal protein L1 [Babesia caballi]
MLHTAAFFRAISAVCGCLRLQTREKKYLPFYTEVRKRPARKSAKAKAAPAAESATPSPSADAARSDLVSRLASPTEALEVLRSLRCSLGGVDRAREQYMLRLWTRVDVKRVALRGMAMLPHPVGPRPRVVAICEDDEVALALECGAAYAGLDSILERIAGGWTNFDTCVTTTVHMPKLVKVARILGPKKLMPNMKEGTLSSNLLEAVRRLSSCNSVQFRALSVGGAEFEMLRAMLSRVKKFELEADHIGVLEVPIAQGEAGPQSVVDNAKHFIREVMKQRPPAAARAVASEFQWPPVRKSLNAILEDAFSTLGAAGEVDNEFIVGGALGLLHQGRSVVEPLMVDTGHLL